MPTKYSVAAWRSIVTAGMLAILSPTIVSAAPPSPEGDIDYAASGFSLPPGVHPGAWSTAAGVSAVGGMNFASQPAISGPMMGGPGMGGPMMGGPAMGPMMGDTPLSQKIPSSFPSGPIPGMPGGMPVSTGLQGPIGPAAYQAAMQSPYGQVMPVDYQAGQMEYAHPSYQGGYGGGGYACDSYGESYGGAGSCGDPNCGCGGGYNNGYADGGGSGFQGILPAIMGHCNLCNDQGCGVCNSRVYQSGCLGRGGMLGDWCSGKCMQGDAGILLGTIGGGAAACCNALLPYSEGGKCAQRWYDLSVEGLFLGNNFSQGNTVLTTRGIDGPAVLSLDDVKATDLEAGVRVSAAVIMGVGGNLEVTYLGGQEWNNSGQAFADDPNNPDLYSYISDYGTLPLGGYDDTDRSIIQQAYTKSRFHSGEFNYRRRAVGPGCRFQGSWLAGARYLRLDNDFGYGTIGTFNDGTGGFGGGSLDQLRYYDSLTATKNNIFVGQIGYDVWWNMVPGVQLGFGMKGGWGQNDWERSSSILANSIGPGATAGSATINDRDRRGAVMGEMETTLVYRLSHAWSFRSSYHLLAVNNIVNTVPEADYIRSSLTTLGSGGVVTARPAADFSDVVLQGFTVGAEYMW